MKSLKSISVLTKLNVPILLSLAVFIIFLGLIVQLKSIDKADKLKMRITSQNSLLIKEIAYYSELITNGNYEYSNPLNISLSKFSKNLEILEKGGKYLNIDRVELVSQPNEEEKHLLSLVKEQWNNYYLNANLLLETKNKNKTKFATGEIEKTQQILYKKNDAVYAEYQKQNSSINLWLAYISSGTLLLFFVLVGAIFIFFRNNIFKPIVSISKNVKLFIEGEKTEAVKVKTDDEIGAVTEMFNKIIVSIEKNTVFASQIAKGNTNYEYIPNKNDNLGLALVEMRNDLIKMKKLDEISKIQQEKEEWKNKGKLIFTKLLLNYSENKNEFAENFIHTLVKHTSNISGAFYLFKNEKLEQVSKYAYNRNKFTDNNIDYNEGLLGEVINEKKSKILTDVPNNYMRITSGLGDATPKFLIITPITFNEEVFGVVELAGFNEMDTYKIDFVESVVADLAFMVSTTENSKETNDIKEIIEEQTEIISEQNKIIYSHSLEIEELRQDINAREKEIKNLNFSITKEIIINQN